MELLQEVKKSNKQAFIDLVEKYNHIFYKAARLYFISDKDVYAVLEHALSKAFREVVNFKTEKEFLCWTLRTIIVYGSELKQKYSKDVDRKIRNKEFSVNIGDKITSTESMVDNADVDKNGDPIINIYAYLRGDLRTYVLKYGYSKNHYGKNTTKQFDTWLEALRNLRNICAHHNILVGKTSSVVLPELTDAQVLISDTDLLSRLYALKKILPISEHERLKHDLQKLVKHSKINTTTLGILPIDWETRYDDIFVL